MPSSVFKDRKKSNNTRKTILPRLTLPEDAKLILQQLFTLFPPDDGDLVFEVARKFGGKSDKPREWRDDMFCKPRMNKGQIQKKLKYYSALTKVSPKLRQITEKRSNLPIASFKDVITSTVETHQVVLISGETGCGKTTQVPQFLLDYMWSKGESCKLVCTQPRRISATSVAERISSERGQTIGEDVGYKIRLESKGGMQSSIVFCTTGILLRVLENTRVRTEGSNNTANNTLLGITHIVVDEIHERDRFSDFSLAILREILPSYPHLRLVLMSATLDSERFSQYFGGCPIIRVPGFTYPVKAFYLDDVLSLLKVPSNDGKTPDTATVETDGPELTYAYRSALDEAITLAWSTDECDSLLDLISSQATSQVFNYQHSSNGLTPLMVLAGKGRVGDVCMLLSLGANCHLKAKDGTTAMQLAEREKQIDACEVLKKHTEDTLLNTVNDKQLLDKYLSTANPILIDIVLIGRLLKRLCVDSEEGGILVFLSGWDDINRTQEKLLTDPFFQDSSKFSILALHSMIPSVDQKKVFQRPPLGCRKIVLSTNIAETSVTIDDIVYVIDSGRLKEKNYDPFSNVSTLQSAWVSKASAKQREGRAGRCQPGTCYHLYSKSQASSLLDFQLPEIKRMPIEELCLQVKLMDPNNKIDEFLQKTLDPPIFETIRNAITFLQDIGALTSDEDLTELGEKLGSLPVHPLTSKMLFIAITLNCLEPALTLACASGIKDPFTLATTPADKKELNKGKIELASLYGGYSDDLALVAAFECWQKAKEIGEGAKFCSQFFLSPNTLRRLANLRIRLYSELKTNGYISDDQSNCSMNARDPGILRTVLVAGLCPKVGKLLPPLDTNKSCAVETFQGAKVRIFIQSTNFNLTYDKSNGYPLLVYDEITRGDRGISVRKCSIVGPLSLALVASEFVVASAKEDNAGAKSKEVAKDGIDEMGKEKQAEEEEDTIMSSPDKPVNVVINKWLAFDSPAIDTAQIYCLRERLSAAVLFKATYPRKPLPPPLEASIYAISCILSLNGLSGINVSFQNSKPNTSTVDASKTAGEQASDNKATENPTRTNFLKMLWNKGPSKRTRYADPKQLKEAFIDQYEFDTEAPSPVKISPIREHRSVPIASSSSTEPKTQSQKSKPKLGVRGVSFKRQKKYKGKNKKILSWNRKSGNNKSKR